MGVDYNEELQCVAVALVDREIHIFRAKQTGNRISFVTVFSFRAKLPSNSAISCISLEKHVKGATMLIVGTFQGDIRIYDLDIDLEFEGLSDKQKTELKKEPRLIEGGSFNFFNKNSRKEESNFPVQRRMSNVLLKGKMTIKRSSEALSPDSSRFQHNAFPNRQLLDNGVSKLIQDDHWRILMDMDDRSDPERRLKLLREFT